MLGGNPQRRVRPNIIARGTEVIISHIRERANPEELDALRAARGGRGAIPRSGADARRDDDAQSGIRG